MIRFKDILNEGLKPTGQIGKRPKKEDILDAKKGRTWVTPKNRRYEFDYEKNGNKYTFIIIYKGHRMRLSEPDYNRTNIDDLLDSMDHGLDIK